MYLDEHPELWPDMEGYTNMTRQTAARSRIPGLRGFNCFIYAMPAEGMCGWWMERSRGTTPDIGLAHTYSVGEAIDLADNSNLLCIIDPDEVIRVPTPEVKEEKQEKAEDKPITPSPVRRCNVLDMLPSNLVAMLKAAPNNKSFRAMVSSKVLEMPPDEADTWDKIKDWIEFNFPKLGKTDPAAPVVTLRVAASTQEEGKCRYSRTLTADWSYKLTVKTVLDAYREHHGELYDIICAVYDDMRDQARQHFEEGETDTSRHEPDNEGEIDIDCSGSALSAAVKKVLAERLTPDEYNEINM